MRSRVRKLLPAPRLAPAVIVTSARSDSDLSSSARVPSVDPSSRIVNCTSGYSCALMLSSNSGRYFTPLYVDNRTSTVLVIFPDLLGSALLGQEERSAYSSPARARGSRSARTSAMTSSSMSTRAFLACQPVNARTLFTSGTRLAMSSNPTS